MQIINVRKFKKKNRWES